MGGLKIVAGLGNPGKGYERTRHNVGFRVIDHLAGRQGIALRQRKFRGQLWKGQLQAEGKVVPAVLLKPLTFMNESGSALQAAAHFYRVPGEDIVIIHDDLDLLFGKLRIRERGGDSGQRGVRSIIQALGSDQFVRLRFGIGRPPVGVVPEDYVLETFLPEEASRLPEILDRAVDALETVIFEGSVPAMNRFNP
jgi:PTH1 family peptidyl-tRNA hydrolase